ncbi:MAG: serine hydrolase [Candidatus Terrybacteria bacterium]|nr:serine hydrolase [Candidatus Terrybacteria bacterium]
MAGAGGPRYSVAAMGNAKACFVPRYVFLAVCCGAFLGCAAPTLVEDSIPERPARPGSYRFIDPLLDCRQNDARREIRPFQRELAGRVDELRARGRASHISVYFRDLRNGSWIGIGEKEDFLPASLLKVPLMMSILRAAEASSGLLDEQVSISTQTPAYGVQRFSMPSELVAGSAYPIGHLVSAMIRSSDNTAMWELFRRFGGSGMHDIYEELGLPSPANGVPDHLRVKDYASIFRLLYNASYLGRSMSEKALEELAHSEFGAGISASIPRSIPVAHKYGERALPSGEKQLHDCGIVYYPGSPYVLCVMTRGRDWAALAEVIQSVSATAYREVRSQMSEQASGIRNDADPGGL